MEIHGVTAILSLVLGIGIGAVVGLVIAKWPAGSVKASVLRGALSAVVVFVIFVAVLNVLEEFMPDNSGGYGSS